jgi:hypothetical protein
VERSARIAVKRAGGPAAAPVRAVARVAVKHAGALVAVPLLAVGLAACATTVATNSFTGPAKAVAQRISDYQKDVLAADEKKLCNEDFSRAVRTRLNKAGGCEGALKRQIGSIDDYELKVEKIAVSGARATATVKSTWSGKLRSTTLTLVEEGAAWRIAGAG